MQSEEEMMNESVKVTRAVPKREVTREQLRRLLQPFRLVSNHRRFTHKRVRPKERRAKRKAQRQARRAGRR